MGVNATDFIIFYNWDGVMIQKVNITPREVYWNPKHNMLTITGKQSFFLLNYDSEVSLYALKSGSNLIRKLKKLWPNWEKTRNLKTKLRSASTL